MEQVHKFRSDYNDNCPMTMLSKSFVFSMILFRAVTALTGVLGCTQYVSGIRQFPEYFKFGVATAAYQIEGAWNVSDKAISIWDVFSKKPGFISDGSNGDDACKSYYYYKRDIEMVKFLGVNSYRFSVSWPRLFPNGFTNTISEDGKRYYNSLIDELVLNGIDPILTMYHWDLPQKLQNLGGWANPLIIDWFGDYAKELYSLFGDRVKTWITINEPKQVGIFGYGMSTFAPGLNISGIADYIAVKNILLAHARAWHVYDEEFRGTQKGVCGIGIASDFRTGASYDPEDIDAGFHAMDFEVAMYMQPIFSTIGGFPERIINRVMERSREQGYHKSRLPILSDEEIEYIKGTSDFLGMNHYSTQFFTPRTPGQYAVPSYLDDMGGNGSYLHYEVAAAPHTTSIPYGIRKTLSWIRENYNNPIVMITENGFSTFGGLDDEDRINYFKGYLSNILDAIEEGSRVVSYTAWSLMDNFEWTSGYRIKFGLFQVDFEDDYRRRYARRSALWYKQTIATRALDLEYIPELEDNIWF